MKLKSSMIVMMFILYFSACGFAESEDKESLRKAPELAAAELIQWVEYQEGLSRAKNQNKKIFLNFFADWCRYCKMMDQKTFRDQEIIAYLNDNFVPVRVDADRNRKVSREFNVEGLPVSWFISESGENIGSQPGYIPPDLMLPLLKYIDTDSYKTMNFETFKKGL